MEQAGARAGRADHSWTGSLGQGPLRPVEHSQAYNDSLQTARRTLSGSWNLHLLCVHQRASHHLQRQIRCSQLTR